MIADLNEFDVPAMPGNPGRACTKNSDCQGGLSPDWAGYCAHDDHRCWVRPDSQTKLCQISGLNGPAVWPFGDHPIPPYDLRPFNFVHPVPVRWRVVACLNKYDPATANRGCKEIDSTERKEVFGDPRLIQSTL
jgi:hypothetical protein